MTNLFDTVPSSERPRSYSGGYMAAGDNAQNIIMDWLRPTVNEIKDVRDDWSWQERGVDFIVIDRKNKEHWCESKSDKHLDVSEKFLFELQRINLTAPDNARFVLGWSSRSEAKWLFVYAPSSNKIHGILFREYRDAFLNAARQNDVELIFTPTDAIKRTINALFPCGYLQAMPSYRIHQLERKDLGNV